MTYFDCFVVGSWMFAMGWFFGAIYVQNHNEETANEEKQSLPVAEKPERCPECEAWRLPAVASASAD
jgi:hypothetical protein